jgi:hypothetical protein
MLPNRNIWWELESISHPEMILPRIALLRERGEHGRLDRVRHWRDSLIDDEIPPCG